MKFEITHRTIYDYASAVITSQHLVHLEPRELPNQKVLSHELTISPQPVSQIARVDYFGNPSVAVRIEVEHFDLEISAHSMVEVAPARAINVGHSPPWEEVANLVASGQGDLSIDASQFAAPSRHTGATAAIAEFARASFLPRRAVLAAAQDLSARIFEEFTFDATATDVSTPVSEVLEKRRGVCQDFSHLMIAALKCMGLPARYVSGYILTHPPPGKPRLQGADASHAWVSVWCPHLGWIDFDPTNNVIPKGEHITIGFGRDYDDVNPISGVLLGGHDHTVTVEVDVVPA